jgi:hypothetical protein
VEVPGSLVQQVEGQLSQVVARTVVGTPVVGEVDRTDYSVLVVVVVVVVMPELGQMNSPKYFAQAVETQGPVSRTFT